MVFRKLDDDEPAGVCGEGTDERLDIGDVVDDVVAHDDVRGGDIGGDVRATGPAPRDG